MCMAVRKSLLGPTPERPELDRLLEHARTVRISDEQLQEQRVSFAWGNAPDSDRITKDSVRDASKSIRITQR
jgi:hypothetical protein